ncbi:MAG: hypothetical protein QNJ41_14020 [Xenococcaceae cyanobacterium MO_188.B32]|nr:hypothetical protein [Xenococcaceae cyanobacterium MO_188.B32]
MNKWQDLSAIATLLLIFGSVGVVSGASILANKQNDPHHCQLSPNNRGCTLNRPIDIAATKNKNTSFQFVYDPQENTMRLIKVNY